MLTFFSVSILDPMEDCCIVRWSQKISPPRINSQQVRRPSSVSTPAAPEETETQNYSSVKFGLLHKRQIIIMWPQASFAVQGLFVLASVEIQQNTLGTPKCVKVVEPPPPPPAPNALPKPKIPAPLHLWNSINGTRCDCRVVGASKY